MPSNQTGGTNPYRIYQGYYKLTNINSKITVANPYVLLTTDCFVIFLSNITVNSDLTNNDVLFTIPAQCLDGLATIRIPIAHYNSTNGASAKILTIDASTGNCRIMGGASSGWLYTEGQSYNIVRKYYNNLDNYQ